MKIVPCQIFKILHKEMTWSQVQSKKEHGLFNFPGDAIADESSATASPLFTRGFSRRNFNRRPADGVRFPRTRQSLQDLYLAHVPVTTTS